jgi:hypothetical protein|tara:strand:+ start:5377 stop:5772 length:396 start_codon:yes stop_codon:yes gene_type:complete
MRTEVYYNLHKKVFSIRKGGKVVSHASCVLIHQPSFVVQEGGRKRVRSEGRKNVHAFVTCKHSEHIVQMPPGRGSMLQHPVTYNPYTHTGFMVGVPRKDGHHEQPISHAWWAWLFIGLGNKPRIEVGGGYW